MALSHPYAFHTLYNKAPVKRPCTNHASAIGQRIRPTRRPTPSHPDDAIRGDERTAFAWRHTTQKPQNQQKLHFI